MKKEEILAFRRGELEKTAKRRDELRKHPKLYFLFFELTDACNMSCLHCGSSCSSENRTFLPKEEIYNVLDLVASTYSPREVMICLTGGEPMLHPDFYEIIDYVDKKGFPWGMTTNGTLIDQKAAERLVEYHIGSLSISLDGLMAEHDYLRNQKGAFLRTVAGIQTLQDCMKRKQWNAILQATTVVHKKNIDKMEEMYEYLCEIGVEDWRLTNIEPIGRSLDRQDLMLDNDDFQALFSFIKKKRFDSKVPMEVMYGCSHYITPEWERMIRDNYFFCEAGVYVASILCNGDIFSCLDIERRPELIQGNIRTDNFIDVWENRFLAYRTDRTEKSEMCSSCSDRYICGGDSFHTWDFDKNEPRVCLKNMSF